MSFVITINVPAGIVLASDSRQSVTIESKDQEGKPLPKFETVSSDFVYKTFLLKKQQVGINSFGDSLLGKIATESHIKSFSEQELVDDDNVITVPRKLIDYLRKDFPEANTSFFMAGYKKVENKSIPHVYRCHVGKNSIERVNVDKKTGKVVYGASWGGQADVIASLLNPMPNQPKAPILWDAMNVQDAIDFAIYAVRTTADTMRFQARPKNVGGPIDVLLISPDADARWIQRKELRGELFTPI